MGVYYYFYNATLQIHNQLKIFNQLTFIAKFEGDIDCFKKVIKINKWNETDEIHAVPDYEDYPVYVYKNNKVYINNELIECNINNELIECNINNESIECNDGYDTDNKSIED